MLYNKPNKNNENNHAPPYDDRILTLPNRIDIKIKNRIKIIKKDINIVIAVLSSPNNFKKRYSFRYISNRYNKLDKYKILFFIGSFNHEDKYLLNKEISLYNDIVHLSYENSYFNLTILSIIAIKYCFNYFKNLKYFIKTDDDMLVNYNLLNYILKSIYPFSKKIYGHLDNKFKVNRDNRSKSYIPYFQYPHKYAPKYVYGGLIIITKKSLELLYNQTKYERSYVWKEDVNLGIMCEFAGINVQHFPSNVDIKVKGKKCDIINRIVATEIYTPYDDFYCLKNINSKIEN